MFSLSAMQTGLYIHEKATTMIMHLEQSKDYALSPFASLFMLPSAAAAMSGVNPFFNLLLGGGGGFFPDSFFGAPSFFFLGNVGGVSSSSGRLGGPELGVLPFSMGVLFRFT